jgi:hypothetical protein
VESSGVGVTCGRRLDRSGVLCSVYVSQMVFIICTKLPSKTTVQDSRKYNIDLVLAVGICAWLYSLCNIAG